MIILDTDVLLVDYRYPRDARFADNRRALDRMRQDGHWLGVTTQALLEMVGVLSFNVSSNLVEKLPSAITTQYRLTLFPNPVATPDYAGCSYDEIVYQMKSKMG